MKNSAAFILLLFIGKLIYAQDSIVKRNKEIILAKIIEISPTNVKFKKSNFQDGPTYIENKSDISYIRFSNGLKEEFGPPVQEEPLRVAIKSEPELSSNADYYNPNAGYSEGPKKIEPFGSRYKYQGRKISEKEMQKILMKTQDKELIVLAQDAKDARALSYIGWGAFPLGLASAIVFSQPNSNAGNLAAGTVLFLGSIACPIISGVYSHKRKVNNKRAVDMYNQRY
jgi:hypothetical protein